MRGTFDEEVEVDWLWFFVNIIVSYIISDHLMTDSVVLKFWLVCQTCLLIDNTLINDKVGNIFPKTTELQHFTISHFNFYAIQMTSIDIDGAIWREKSLSLKRGGGVSIFFFDSVRRSRTPNLCLSVCLSVCHCYKLSWALNFSYSSLRVVSERSLCLFHRKLDGA